MASTTFQKREKETKRKDKARDKEQRRDERKAGKQPRDASDGIDPDIAGIVPGPQPNPLEDEEV
jgi:hypothetical protein